MGEMAEAADGSRAAEQISLHLVTHLVLQELQLSAGLDAFGEHRQAQSATEAQYRQDDRRGLTIGIDRLDEGAIDLDPVERKRAQIGQRRIAGAEIVHRNRNAERLDLPQHRKRPVEIANQRRLGDLDLEAPWRQAGLEQDLVQFLDEAGIVELHGRDVDGDLQRLRPRRRLAASRPQDPVSDLQDRAGLLGDRDEDHRRNLAAYRVLPAQQGFEADNVAAFGFLL